MKKNFIKATVLALAVMFAAILSPAQAQLLHVKSKYRIVNVDTDRERIGVALPNANPHVRQSWVYIKPSTRGSVRKYLGHGAFRDKELGMNQIIDEAIHHKGDVFQVYGGRDWDGSIDAHTVWL